MSDKINGRTPDEIKNGLEIVKDECLKVECSSSTCPYYKDCAPRTGMMREVPAQLVRDNIKYIQHLESERDQYKHERDAIEDDFAYLVSCIDVDYTPKACEFCTRYFPGYGCNPCKFEWRGVQEVE